MSNTGDRRAHRHHEKIGVDESEDIQSGDRHWYRFRYKKYKFKPTRPTESPKIESEDIQSGDRRAGISHYRTYAEKSLRGDDESLDEASEDIVALENPEAWKIWKNMLLTNQPKMQEFGSQMAVYMHCMLQ